MSELTKEHFEEITKDLATKKDLEGLVTNETLDEKLEGLATKHDLESLATKKDLADAFEKQQDYMEERFKEIKDELGVEAKFLTIEKRLEKIEERIGIK